MPNKAIQNIVGVASTIPELWELRAKFMAAWTPYLPATGIGDDNALDQVMKAIDAKLVMWRRRRRKKKRRRKCDLSQCCDPAQQGGRNIVLSGRQFPLGLSVTGNTAIIGTCVLGMAEGRHAKSTAPP